MTGYKVIGRLLCGSCDPKNRHIMAKLVDTANGAALRATFVGPDNPPSRFGIPPRLETATGMCSSQRWVTLSTILTPWRLGAPITVGGAFLPEYFAEMEESYRRTGKPVVRVIELNR